MGDGSLVATGCRGWAGVSGANRMRNNGRGWAQGGAEEKQTKWSRSRNRKSAGLFSFFRMWGSVAALRAIAGGRTWGWAHWGAPTQGPRLRLRAQGLLPPPLFREGGGAWARCGGGGGAPPPLPFSSTFL